MEKTIRITGTGRMTIKPDTIRMSITQTGIEKKYENAVQKAAKDKKSLDKVIELAGFEKADLKTTSYNVDAKFKRSDPSNYLSEQKLIGYKYTHHMKLEFPADSTVLNKVLGAVMECSGSPEISISYTIADQEVAKNELLARAVADSKTKANVLCNAAGVALKEIVNIDYSWSEVEFESPYYMKAALSWGNQERKSISMNMTPEDIEIMDTVTVIWAIG